MAQTKLADLTQDNSPFPQPERLVELMGANRLFSELLDYAPAELLAYRIADLTDWQDWSAA